MEVYNSDEERVEALKRWWDENGRTVIVTVALTLLAVVGWQYWMGYQANRAESAAILFQNLSGAAKTEQTEQATEFGHKLVGEYPDSAFAGFAALEMAALAVDDGDLDAAQAHLRWVIDKGAMDALRDVARVRLARVLVAADDAEQALSVLDNVAEAARGASYHEVMGDAKAARGDADGAQQAYEQALAGYTQAPERRRFVQMKLDDLGVREG